MSKFQLAFYNSSEHYKSEIFLILALPYHGSTLGHFYTKIPLITSLDDSIYTYVCRYMYIYNTYNIYNIDR